MREYSVRLAVPDMPGWTLELEHIFAATPEEAISAARAVIHPGALRSFCARNVDSFICVVKERA